jgi:hypothetical protein
MCSWTARPCVRIWPLAQPFVAVVHAAKLSTLPLDELYGRASVHARAKRLLSKKEKKALGLA